MMIDLPRKATRAFLLSIFVLSSLSMSAALSPVSAKDPDPASNPVLANILRLGGVKIYFLGSRNGLDGWLIVKANQVQIAYEIPGSQDVMLGALFGPSGENITSVQVQAILDAHPDLKIALVNNAAQQPVGTPGSSTNLQNSVANIAAQIQAQSAARSPKVVELQKQITDQQQVLANAIAQRNASLSSGVGAAPAPVAAPVASPGERLMKDLQAASGVNLGSSSAPLLIMVMDPTCPHCQKTWTELRDRVLANNLQVRLVPIARDSNNAEDERAASQLLHLADPLESWNKYVAGDKTALAGTADPLALNGVQSNQVLVDNWHISTTPFLVYRGQDGKVKIVEGEPKDIDQLVSDISAH